MTDASRVPRGFFETIHARRQQGLQIIRDGKVGTRAVARQTLGRAVHLELFRNQNPVVDQCAYHFFDKERISPRLFEARRPQLRRKIRVREQTIDQLIALGV